MNLKKAVKSALVDKNMTMVDLAEEMSRTGTPQAVQTLYNTMARGNITLEKLERIADLLGCDVVLVDRTTGKTFY